MEIPIRLLILVEYLDQRGYVDASSDIAMWLYYGT